ncbi:glycoside hydrolase family 2 TIM barrel-domain containing protein [Archangium violaceum]|uniref:glycoside hydrolase family 2 protein n=1 Tax=Archangium violaceum TaxID=83451 RepID=UPI002B2CB9F3|nr:glycoside hydrolase family 2 TIM barrel-domain containing protein [Archangium gephyra]
MPRTTVHAARALLLAVLWVCQSCSCPGPTPPPPELATGERLVLREGWQLQSSAELSATGAELSRPGFEGARWHPARVPSTVVGALVEAGVFPQDLYQGMNLRSLPGMDYPIGENFTNLELPSTSPFLPAWWYRTEFELPAGVSGRKVWLTLDGINYRANVWLNGQQVGTLSGTYRSFELDVTGAARPGGRNALAVELFAPWPTDLAHTWIDWNPTPPDKNMGLWRDVSLTTTGPVAIRNPQVVTRLESEALAHLTVSAELRNTGEQPRTGTLRGSVAGVWLESTVTLLPGEVREVRFTGAEVSGLDVRDPALWWPAQYGPQSLHTLELEFVEQGGAVSDRSRLRFGIREITSSVTENGRVFRVNGRPILIRGAGWARDMLFMESAEREAQEVSLVRDLGLNAVRFEGKFGSDHLLDLLDEAGILVIAGWSCCDVWENWGRDASGEWTRELKWNEEQRTVAEASTRDMALRLRNHPSVIAWWYGSDNPPEPETEAMYLRVLGETRWPNPVQSSATSMETALGGPTGLKMRGPYDWVPPNYWLEDTRRGGAFGFATEISPGAAIPEIESLTEMLGPEHLWPIDEVWSYHCGAVQFRTVDAFTAALSARYGTASGVLDYTRKAQAMTYEAQRAMFEAYSQRKYQATGVIQWMLNNAWPSLIWHLYDSSLAAGGGYYGTKKALEPLHVQYSALDRSVVVVNSGLGAHPNLRVSARVLAFDLTPLHEAEATVSLGPDGVATALVLPVLTPPSDTYFVRLELRGADGAPHSTNFYWLPARPDVLDYDYEGPDAWYMTPTTSYANLTRLQGLAPVALEVEVSPSRREGDEQLKTVRLTNPSTHLAFMVRLKLTHGPGGAEVLPTRWEDNYVSLLPGESRTVTARYTEADARGAEPTVESSGWNVPKTTH